jgi:glycosyltransferase involved in cell wall biosynthesis
MSRRILFIDEDQERNGSTVSLEYIVQGFKAAGYDPVVLTWKVDEWTKAGLKSSATLVDSRWGPVTTLTMCLHFMYTASPFSLRGMRTILKDVVKFVVGFVIVWRAIRRIRPDIVYVNEYSVVQASIAACVCRVPSVMHIRSRMLTGLFGLRRWLVGRMVMRSNDAVFAITRCDADQWQARAGEKQKISVVGEFFPLTIAGRTRAADVRSTLGLPIDRKLVTMVGGLVDIKGAREFLLAGERILARCPQAFFVVAGGARIGGDPQKQAYHDACMTLLKDLEARGALRYFGEVPNALDIIAASDVLVSPSLQSHFSRPVIEAWGFGKPVVAFRLPHMEELITHEVTGLLVACGDVDALADAIVRVLNDESLARRMGEAGRKRTESEFDADKNLARIIARCDSLAGGS